MTVDLTGLLEQACRTRDALQVEIDAAIDRHGVRAHRRADDFAAQRSPLGGVA